MVSHPHRREIKIIIDCYKSAASKINFSKGSSALKYIKNIFKDAKKAFPPIKFASQTPPDVLAAQS
jgi:hypothetical protein